MSALIVGAACLLVGLVAGALVALVVVAWPLAKEYDALEHLVADLEAEVGHVVW